MKHTLILLAPICQNRISGPLFSVTKLSEVLQSKSVVYSTLIRSEYPRKFGIFDALKSKEKNYIITGIWHPRTLLIIAILSLRNKVVVSTRGNLTKSSLKKSMLKKKFILLIMPLIFRRIRAFHYLSDLERLNSVSFGIKRFIIAPNSLPKIENSMRISSLDKVSIGWLGRFDWDHKGLDRLLDLIAYEKDFFKENGIRVRMAGTNYRNGREKFMQEVYNRDLSEIVEIQSELLGDLKHGFLQSLDCLIYTSRYEGVPQVVGEGQIHGLPCALTNGCNIELEPGIDLALIFNPHHSHNQSLEFRQWLMNVKNLHGRRKTIYNRSMNYYGNESINKYWSEVFS